MPNVVRITSAANQSRCGDTCAVPQEFCPPLPKAEVLRHRRRDKFNAYRAAPNIRQSLDKGFILFLVGSPLIVLCFEFSRIATADNECFGSLRIGSRKKRTHCSVLGVPKQCSSFRSDCIHNGKDIVHAFFNGRCVENPVG